MILHGMGLWGAVAGVFVASAMIIYGLTLVPPRFRRSILVAAVFFSGLFYALEFFLPTHAVRDSSGGIAQQNALTPYIPTLVSPMDQVLSAFMIGLGLISLIRVHLANVTRRRPGYYNSIALLVSALVMLVVGYWASASDTAPGAVKEVYDYLFTGLYQNMDAAMFSLIAFFILSAAYRAFRVRSVEAAILMASGLIVLLGLSFGVLLTMWVPDHGLPANFRVETWSRWLLAVISLPALRAIDLGVGLGWLAMGLRIWLGLERGALFGD